MPSIRTTLVCLIAAISADALAADLAAPLTRVQEIRRLSRADASRQVPVRFKGVVIWQDTDRKPSIFVHDGHASIWVDRATAHRRNLWQGGDPPSADTQVGAMVEVEGISDPGGYAPCVVPTKIRRMGDGPLPEPKVAPLERLLSGSEDGQFVQVEGVIQNISKPDQLGDAKIMMMVDGHLCRVASEFGYRLDAMRLVDARVRIRGLLVPLPNLRSEVAGLRLNIMGPEDITVIVPPPADPFSAPRVPLDELLPFAPDTRPFHRKVTSGVVTLAARGRFFFLQDGTRSVRVQSDETKLSPGDHVEVAGFIDTSQTLAALTGARVRHLGKTGEPKPVRVSVETILHPEFRNDFEKVADSDFSGRLVRFQGQLVKLERDAADAVPTLLIAAEGNVFQANLTEPPAVIPPDWVEGATLDLTGIAELDFKEDTNTQGSISISGFRLWLRAPSDVVVLAVPSWWTPRRLALALAALATVLILAIAWNLALRHLLRKRGRLLEEVMRRHRDSEIEFEGARQERRRLAGDLHDGLQQLMAGAAYRVEAAAAHLGDMPPAVEAQLTAARRALVRSQNGLREVLWGLQHMEEDSDDFVALLRHAVGTVEHWPQDAVEVGSEGPPFPVSRQVRGSLLLLMQEAVGNAFKHGAAHRVGVSLVYATDHLGMVISDDGKGFDPAKAPGPREGHFGLESTRLRMKWLGGTLEIRSAPGEGTRILCKVPAARARANDSNKLEEKP
jgi:signal transduction histidine kinase